MQITVIILYKKMSKVTPYILFSYLEESFRTSGSLVEVTGAKFCQSHFLGQLLRKDFWIADSIDNELYFINEVATVQVYLFLYP